VYSIPGGGTTFRILLPATVAADVDQTKAARPQGAEEDEAQEPTGTILVIDDEEIVRATADTVLQRLGYAVVTVADRSQAVEIFRALNQKISVVLLDMTMPGISIEETITELRKINPGVPTILSSGFGEAEALRRRFGDYGFAGFLQKPYTTKTLASRIKMASVTAASAAPKKIGF
jgi:CheY-like chemotaxis protein